MTKSLEHIHDIISGKLERDVMKAGAALRFEQQRYLAEGGQRELSTKALAAVMSHRHIAGINLEFAAALQVLDLNRKDGETVEKAIEQAGKIKAACIIFEEAVSPSVAAFTDLALLIARKQKGGEL